MDDIINKLNSYPKGYWDFKGKTKKGIHSIGKYPATMVPDMQEELLNIIVNQIKDENIQLLDPFCGSGTTLVISQKLGIESVGIDINPYATLLSSVKTNVYNYNKVLSAVTKIETNLNTSLNYNNHYFFNIEKWFKKEIIQSLSKIRFCIISEPDKDIRNFFWICLSETISKFSNDRTSTFKLHSLSQEKINLIQNNCIEFFINKIKDNSKFLNYEKTSRVKVFYGDCTEVMKNKLDKKFKIICTSPPYGDNSTTVTYGQASILSLKWIDKKDLACTSEILDRYSTIDKISIGGIKREIDNTADIHSLNNYLNRITKNKTKKVINFFEDYYNVMKNIENILDRNGFLIMTVGNRRIDSIIQPLDDITIEIAEKLGLKIISKFNRNILHKKTPFTSSSSKSQKLVKSISEETILIFLK